ncbi:hypothetical protein KP509_25G040200 [Ceratopteris richardii]|uniref:Uncharacterized protein n=1 Tax=Ceratopteris richardii TaxID=49495 RepID=A0A8T2RPN1_CERRI|nr:hypothetical protein KP509_25G040200 [Ceratopteris richardii]
MKLHFSCLDQTFLQIFRQHQFFEQRRQRLRLREGVDEPTLCKPCRPQEKTIYSLDIESLKNLSQLIQSDVRSQTVDARSQTKSTRALSQNALKADDIKRKTVHEEAADDHQNRHTYLSGSQPTSTLDVAVHMKATVGTQWTPTSAAAAAATAAAFIRPVDETLHKPCDVHIEGKGYKCMDNQDERQFNMQQILKQNKSGDNHLQQRPPSFRILDLINDSRNSKQSKETHYEDYAAYALEGLGNVADWTPKPVKAPHMKTRNRDEIPACNSKHKRRHVQSFNEEINKVGSPTIQYHNCFALIKDDAYECLTDKESFANSNRERCSKKYCKRKGHGSFREPCSGRMDVLYKLQNVGSSIRESQSRPLLKRNEFLYPDLPLEPSTTWCDESYGKCYESPESSNFSLSEMFPISEYRSISSRSADISYQMNDFNLCDDVLTAHNSLYTGDVLRNHQLKDSSDKNNGFDDSASSMVQLSPLFGKVPCEVQLNSPIQGVFSEASSGFEGLILETNPLKKEYQSPSFWRGELDVSEGDMSSHSDLSLSCLQDDKDLTFLNLERNDCAKFSKVQSSFLNIQFQSPVMAKRSINATQDFFSNDFSDRELSPEKDFRNAEDGVFQAHFQSPTSWEGKFDMTEKSVSNRSCYEDVSLSHSQNGGQRLLALLKNDNTEFKCGENSTGSSAIVC